MKCFRYCSVLLLCFALFLGVFSVGVNAASVNVPKFEVVANYFYKDGASSISSNYSFTPRNNVKEGTTSWYNQKTNQSGKFESGITYKFYPIDTNVFFNSGGNISVDMKYVFMQYILINRNTGQEQYKRPATVRVLLVYEDGTMEYVNDITYSGDNYSFICTPKKNVSYFELITSYTWTATVGDSYNLGYSIGEITLDDSTFADLTISVETEEVGLLKGIIDWLKGIKDGITNLFDSITELPAKIWQFISDGLKSLFVPSEEFITDYKDRMDTMLAEKLGAVYECSNVLFESWDRITDSDDTNTIDFPATTIDVGETNFTFGGYQVEIVPQGFDFLANAVKLIVAILCTIAFVNGMRKRYDEVMGG